jgi:methionyl-tRNA synthetase
VPFGNDGDFSHASMISRMNHELANDYGNLVQRVLSMVNKNCNAQVPEPGAFTEQDRALLQPAQNLAVTMRPLMDRQAFHEALEAIWQVVRAANAYVDHQAPWALRKTDPERMATVLYVLAETIRHLGLATLPYMPESSDKILDQLAISKDNRSFSAMGEAGALTSGTALPRPQGVFPRFVEEAA